MKILYDNTDGKIFYAIAGKEWFYFSHTTNIPLTELHIDELVPENQSICQDLIKVVYKTDNNGLGKYYIDTVTTTLMERDGWVEHVEAPS